MKKNKFFYRLTLVEDESHRRIASYRITKFGAIVAGSVLATFLFAISYCIIAFTPVRTLIPGYPDAFSRDIAVKNAIKVDSLENIITRWEYYAANLDNILTGKPTVSLDSIIRNNSTKFLKDISEERMREADSLLRQEVKLEESGTKTEGK